jgi:stearoyl-CoA desaturase (delta-9 desaturase)
MPEPPASRGVLPHGPAAVKNRLPDLGRPRSTAGLVTVWIFVVGPVVALAVTPLTLGWKISVTNATMAIVLYVISGFGISLGFHRYLTHGSFKAGRVMRAVLAVSGSLAIAGAPSQWVATHRHHHACADRVGDPHSPWRYGSRPIAVLKGLGYAHLGWMLRKDLSNRARFAPDIVADPVVSAVDRLFIPISAVSMFGPAVLGGAVEGTWTGAASALLWAGILRVALLHHVIWSVNSICHVVGDRPFTTKDRAANFWPLAIISFGESWHNSHHADPTLARHGVLRGQWDPAARLIWLFERCGLVYDVRWPKPGRLAARLVAPRTVRR